MFLNKGEPTLDEFVSQSALGIQTRTCPVKPLSEGKQKLFSHVMEELGTIPL
jgi:hypothetical protein